MAGSSSHDGFAISSSQRHADKLSLVSQARYSRWAPPTTGNCGGGTVMNRQTLYIVAAVVLIALLVIIFVL